MTLYRKQVESSKSEAAKDGIKVPTTREEYCKTQKEPTTSTNSDVCDEYFYEDYQYQDDEDEYVDDSNDSIDHESDE